MRFILLVVLIHIWVGLFSQNCDSKNVIHHEDKLDYVMDYFHIKPLIIKNKKGQTLKIEISELKGGSYDLILTVNGTQSRLIREREEEAIFVFNDTIKHQPYSYIETNNNGQFGLYMDDTASFKVLEFLWRAKNYNYFKNYSCQIIRVYTSKDYAEFHLTKLESESLKARFNCLIKVSAEFRQNERKF